MAAHWDVAVSMAATMGVEGFVEVAMAGVAMVEAPIPVPARVPMGVRGTGVGTAAPAPSAAQRGRAWGAPLLPPSPFGGVRGMVGSCKRGG